MSLQEPGMSALETLSPELRFLIIGNSTSQAVSCLSEASKMLARVSRRRLHTIEITAGGLSALQHWLEKECDGTACQCGGAFVGREVYNRSVTLDKTVFNFDRVDYRCTVFICRTCGYPVLLSLIISSEHEGRIYYLRTNTSLAKGVHY